MTVSVHGAGWPLSPVHWNGGRVEHSDGAGHCEVTVVIDPGPVMVTGTVTVLPEPHSVGWPLLSVQTGGAVIVTVEPGPVGQVPGEVTVIVEPGEPPQSVGWPLLSVQTGGAVIVMVEPGPVGHVPGEVMVTVEPGEPPQGVG